MSDENQTEDVDALYDRIMNGESEEVASAPQVEQPPPAPAPVEEYEFTWNGKQIKANKDNLIKWASQGYDYSQKMNDFNKRLQETNDRWSKAETLEKTYGPVDEWVKQNPDKWEALQSAIHNAQASGQSPELLKKLSALEEKISHAGKFIETLQQKEAAEKQKQEDDQLSKDIQSIQEQYKDLDWKTVDESGHDLAYRVCEHAVKTGINSFRAAFRDLMHDDLMKFTEAKGRESLTKERQVKTQTGLLGKTQAPTKGLNKPTNIKNKSYDDLAREGLEELGIQI